MQVILREHFQRLLGLGVELGILLVLLEIFALLGGQRKPRFALRIQTLELDLRTLPSNT